MYIISGVEDNTLCRERRAFCRGHYATPPPPYTRRTIDIDHDGGGGLDGRVMGDRGGGGVAVRPRNNATQYIIIILWLSQ